ncbi:MAG: transposase [Colwellia sp.]
MREVYYFLPAKTPTDWIAGCQYVGRGDSALTYLARYIYRGVISEKNILSLKDDRVTFQYKDSQTKKFNTITEQESAFLWRVLQHVLPKGFRRARNYGFLAYSCMATQNGCLNYYN